jgi:pimeloyl-ACP methyl ester carboxylesterase
MRRIGKVARMLGFSILGIGVALAAMTPWLASRTERQFPPAGSFAEAGGIRQHFIDLPAGEGADLAPLVFLHGASGNARELAGAFAPALEGRARMIFVDRPGAGYSGRKGREDSDPAVQAGYVAALLDELKIERAVIVGHSLGSAIAAAFAVHHRDRTAGLVFLAPATHPWSGGGVTWYYHLTDAPLIGPLFAHVLAVPLGNLQYSRALRGVFSPNRVPADYAQRSGTRLVLRPGNFIANAQDVASLYENVARLQPRYSEIDAPTVIVTGDSDATVLANIHSIGLERDIAGAKLVWLKDTGHMPTYTATDRIVQEIETLNGVIAAREEQRRFAGR